MAVAMNSAPVRRALVIMRCLLGDGGPSSAPPRSLELKAKIVKV
jgi:hypothetical protein